jgi:DNA-binding CsgD family transcriptional regulator
VHDELEPGALSALIGHIYEAVANPAHWADFLSALETHYPGSRITLFTHEDGQPRPDMTFNHNYAPEDLKAYLDYYVWKTPYAERQRLLEIGKPTFYEAMIPDAEIRKTEIHNDYVVPRRLGHYGTGVVVDRGPGRVTALSFADYKDDERRHRELKLLEILTPHLLRAVRMRRLNVPTDAIAHAGGDAFDQWTRAALVLDAAGRVLVMNRLAAELTQRRDGLALAPDATLRGVDHAVTERLQAAIRRAAAIAGLTDAEAPPPSPDVIVLPRPSGALPLQAATTPLPFLGAAGSAAPRRGTVLLVITDPARAAHTPIELIARQFGLTQAEQRLTQALIDGVTLNDAAGQLGIRVSTARNRLKIIQDKTHCRRQVDLVRLAFSLKRSG